MAEGTKDVSQAQYRTDVQTTDGLLMVNPVTKEIQQVEIGAVSQAVEAEVMVKVDEKVSQAVAGEKGSVSTSTVASTITVDGIYRASEAGSYNNLKAGLVAKVGWSTWFEKKGAVWNLYSEVDNSIPLSKDLNSESETEALALKGAKTLNDRAVVNLPTEDDIYTVIKELYIDTAAVDKNLYPDYDFNNLHAVKLHGFGIDTDSFFKIEIRFYKNSTVYFGLNVTLNSYDNQVFFNIRNGIKVYLCLDKAKITGIKYGLNIDLKKDFVFKIYRNPTINLACNGLTDSLRVNSEICGLYLNLTSYPNITEFNDNVVYITSLSKSSTTATIVFKFGNTIINKTLIRAKDDIYINESDSFMVYVSFVGNRPNFWTTTSLEAILDKSKSRSKADNVSVDILNYFKKSTLDEIPVNSLKSYVLSNNIFVNDTSVKTDLKYDLSVLVKEVALINSKYKFDTFQITGIKVELQGTNFIIAISMRGYIGLEYIEYYNVVTSAISTQEDLFVNVMYNPAQSTLANDNSTTYVILDINHIKKILGKGGIGITWARIIDLDKNRIKDDVFFPQIKKKIAVVNETNLVFTKIIKNYLPNPNNGICANTVNTTLNLVDTDVNESIDLTNNLYIHLSDLLTNNAISTSGIINDVQLFQDVKTFFDTKVINTSKNQRWILKLITFWQASGIGPSATLVDNTESPDGKSWTWMPSNMYNYFKILTNSLLTLESTYSSPPFPITNYIVVPDFRNLEFRRILDKVFEQIALYFEEIAGTPLIYSSNNSTKDVKKGDYIAAIQIRLLGPWGEGNTKNNRYPDGFYPYSESDVDTVITYFELYKKHFSKYNLLASTFGSRRITTVPVFDKISYYQLSTKYADGKEFGMYIDHMTNSDTGNDFTLTYNGIDLKQLALEKYKNAQVAGENGDSQDISTSIGIFERYAKEYRYSNIIPWGFRERWNPIGLEYFNSVVNKIGYRLGFIQNLMTMSNGKIQGSLQMTNLGLSYCYDNFWKIQLVERHKYTNDILQVIDVSDSIFEISKKSTITGLIDSKNVYSLNVDVTLVDVNSNLFFRVIDTCRINENMHFFNVNRTSNGEYCINSRTYNINYELNGGRNSPNNLSLRNLYEPLVLKPAYRKNKYFDGWYSDALYTHPVRVIDVDVLTDLTLYAKFI